MKEEEPAFETLPFFSQNETMKNVQCMRLFNLLATASITKNNTFISCKVVKGRVTKIQNEKHALERIDRQMSRDERKSFQPQILRPANCYFTRTYKAAKYIFELKNRFPDQFLKKLEVSLKIEHSSVLQLGIIEILKSVKSCHLLSSSNKDGRKSELDLKFEP
jgi:hypothetical protein